MLDQWSLERVDGVGSYERLLASSLLWLHSLLRDARRIDQTTQERVSSRPLEEGKYGPVPRGSLHGISHPNISHDVYGRTHGRTEGGAVKVKGRGDGMGPMLARIARALGISTVAVTSFRGEKGFFEPSVALGIANYLSSIIRGYLPQPRTH